jgi:hypothetical protein
LLSSAFAAHFLDQLADMSFMPVSAKFRPALLEFAKSFMGWE